jgi:Ca2+-binding RTX toxin-like protein
MSYGHPNTEPSTPTVPTPPTPFPAPVEETWSFQLYKGSIPTWNPIDPTWNTIEATAIDAPVYGTSENDAMLGDEGHNYLLAGEGHDYVAGGAGEDTLVASENLLLLVFDPGMAAAGVDTADHYNLLDGGADNDILFGGEGTDYFAFGSGSGAEDKIYDFDLASDYILIQPNVNESGLRSFEDLKGRITDTDEGARIDLGEGNAVMIAGVSAADLREIDFMFEGVPAGPSILDIPSG